MVKSKSMLTEECHLNDYLKEHGVEVIDTDLGRAYCSIGRRTSKPYRIAVYSLEERRDRRIIS